MHFPFARMRILSATIAAGLGVASAHAATTFEVTNLVSDGSVPAVTPDPDLKNPWGVAFGPTSPMWVSDNVTGVATLYTGAGAKLALTVAIPPVGSANPTGQVFNSTTSDFQINGSKAIFIFDTAISKLLVGNSNQRRGGGARWRARESVSASICDADRTIAAAGFNLMPADTYWVGQSQCVALS